jgi:hypothetical protein
MDTTTTSVEPQKRSPQAYLPLVVAFAGGFIQLASCGTSFIGIGVPVGLAISLTAIITGHVISCRMKRRALKGRWLARMGIAAGYLSLFVIPILGYGILCVVGGICGGGLLSR